MSEQIITANRLSDGAVIFLAADGHWTEDVRQARVESEAEALAELEALGQKAEHDRELIGAYLIDITRDEEGGMHPTRYRERIRAEGPTTHPHHGRQILPYTSEEEAA